MKKQTNRIETGFTLIEVIVTIVIVAIVGVMMVAYFGKSITQSSIPIFRLSAAEKLNQVLEKISAQYGQYHQWQPVTTYAANTILVPSASKRTGLLYTTTAGGTSGTSEPAWPIIMYDDMPLPICVTNKTCIVDGSVTWRAVWDSTHNSTTTNGAAPALDLTAWQPNHQYSAWPFTVPPAAPAAIVYSGTSQYICVTGGTSHNSVTQPSWTTVSSPQIDDGPGSPVKWQYIGPAPPSSLVPLKTAIGVASTTSDVTTVFGHYQVIQNDFIQFDSITKSELPATTADPDYGKYLKVTIGLPFDDPNRGETLTTLFVLR